VSSLLHNGADTNTLRLEGLALRALEKSSKAGITESSVAQHVTAGMLLCSFEVRHTNTFTKRKKGMDAYELFMRVYIPVSETD
jgi:hypothetical protein